MKLTYLIEMDLDPTSDLARSEGVMADELRSHVESLRGVNTVSVSRVALERLETIVRYE